MFSKKSKFGSKKRLFNSSSGQTSLEFIFTLALALMLLVPATIAFDSYAKNTQNSLISSQVHRVGSEIIHLSEKMYASGISWDTFGATLPGSVTNVTVYSGDVSELVIEYQTNRLSEAVFFTDVPLYNETGRDCAKGCVVDLIPGENEIRVESHPGNIVVINPRN